MGKLSLASIALLLVARSILAAPQNAQKSYSLVPQLHHIIPLDTASTANAQGAAQDIAKTTDPSPMSSPACFDYDTITAGPTCTGCVLEAIHPTQLEFPGEVIFVTRTIFENFIIYPDGCTSVIVSTASPSLSANPFGSTVTATTDITWTWNGATLTYPTTYLGYDCFQAGTWKGDNAYGGSCTLQPTTIRQPQIPLVYPSSKIPSEYMSVPSQIVDILQDDSSLNLPFDLCTCTARVPSLSTCRAGFSFSPAQAAQARSSDTSSTFSNAVSTHKTCSVLTDSTIIITQTLSRPTTRNSSTTKTTTMTTRSLSITSRTSPILSTNSGSSKDLSSSISSTVTSGQQTMSGNTTETNEPDSRSSTSTTSPVSTTPNS